MKKITLLMIFTICFAGFAQQQEVVEDFENSPAVTGFEGLASAAIVADPTGSGNGNVFELVTSTAGNPWQGAEVVLADDSVLDLTSDITISVNVYSNVPFSPMAKVETTGSAAPAPFAANTQSHTGSGWEILTFTFNTGSDGTATANGVYNKVVFFPNRSSDDSGWNSPILDATVFFDNITGVKTTLGGGGGGTVNPPTSMAPTPPARPANSTVSIVGDAYGPPVGLNNVPWDDPSEFVEENHAGGDVLKVTYANGNFIGSSLGSQVDISNMLNFHLDVWISDDFAAGQVMNLKLSNHNPNGSGGETNAFEYSFFVSASDVQSWVSLDVPISDWTNVETQPGFTDGEYITEFLITTAGTIDVTYLDNFYFHQNTLGINDFESNQFTSYPNPTSDVWNIKSNNVNIQNVTIYNTLGKTVKEISVDNTDVQINASDLPSGIYFAKLVSDSNQSNTIKLIKQ